MTRLNVILNLTTAERVGTRYFPSSILPANAFVQTFTYKLRHVACLRIVLFSCFCHTMINGERLVNFCTEVWQGEFLRSTDSHLRSISPTLVRKVSPRFCECIYREGQGGG